MCDDLNKISSTRLEAPFDKKIQSAKPSYIVRSEDPWTSGRLIDEFYLYLIQYDIKTDERTGHKISKYQKQAEQLMYRIPVYQPVPSFVIDSKDLNGRLKEELASLDRQSLDNVMKEAIGRIFEDIQERYFKLSVKKLLKCEIKFEQ